MAGLSDTQLNEILDNDIKELFNDVIPLLKRDIPKNSKELESSLDWSFESASGDLIAHARLFFKDHGRYRDMKKVIYQNQPLVEAIREWVLKRGVQAFQKVPGYENSGVVPTNEVAATRIAFAISKHRTTTKFKHKATKWYATNFYKEYQKLLTQIMDSYADFVQLSLREAF